MSKALQGAGLPDTPEQHERFRENYIPLLAEEIEQPGTGHKGLMPGARELLEALDDHDHLHLALLTGNYRDAAEIKLQHFELWDFFEWGAFSATMPRIATRWCRSRAAARKPTTFPVEAIERVIVIGDTPHDIECARVAGAQSIAVATGGFTVDQLREAGADEVLPDLSETQQVIELLL